MQAAPVAINVRKLSEDQLIAIEHALGDFLAEVSDYECGQSQFFTVERRYNALTALCREAGMPAGQDAEGFAREVIS